MIKYWVSSMNCPVICLAVELSSVLGMALSFRVLCVKSDGAVCSTGKDPWLEWMELGIQHTQVIVDLVTSQHFDRH